jgi:heat shock protein HtpX
MMWLRRIGLFVLINIMVVFTISIIVNLLGIQPYLTARGIDYGSLMALCLVWGFGGAFISLLLSRWMAKRMMGVQVIDPENPGNNQERQLLQIVHRLAEKAGMNKMPEVGFFESPSPNAFATGASRNSALVAVSTGLFNSMGQGEIEAVLGHEITHIVNGDMVTMTLLQGVINAFVMFLARVVAFAVMRNGNDRRNGSSIAEFMLIQVLQIVFGIIGMIPLMAFSRWREFRADAGGARLAGRSKMINALKALKVAQERPQLAGAQAQPASMQAFQISSKDGLFSFFASHPPLDVRIQRLESSIEN